MTEAKNEHFMSLLNEIQELLADEEATVKAGYFLLFFTQTDDTKDYTVGLAGTRIDTEAFVTGLMAHCHVNPVLKSALYRVVNGTPDPANPQMQRTFITINQLIC